ncbi:hypothetical protein N0V93_002387 [Gnomoniopsis smithogilvyi]|uniref:Uncharacterized protein n=1 Tax=Gnomoniopsis smithogilvyi TaxID=1191159 RepID=A0A9W8YUP1_9PEZI|nr:hypothetical protein N0V93_002387 [Gnomoniopsis smithogilvyi]
MRVSLRAKSILNSTLSTTSVIVCLAVFALLNTIGVTIFVFQSSSRNGASTASNLVEASAGLQLILGVLLLGAVLVVRMSVNKHDTPRLLAKTVVFFTGAGLCTLSQLVRMASSFYIWKSANIQSSDFVLSKPIYYITGMGFELLAIILYASMRVDLLFASAPSLAPSKTSRLTTADSFRSFLDHPLRMNSVVIKGNRSVSVPTTEYSLTDASTSPLDYESSGSSRGQGSDGRTRHGSGDSRNGMFISIQRTFSISSQKMVVSHNDK